MALLQTSQLFWRNDALVGLLFDSTVLRSRLVVHHIALINERSFAQGFWGSYAGN
jgi:hypothetical protein